MLPLALTDKANQTGPNIWESERRGSGRSRWRGNKRGGGRDRVRLDRGGAHGLDIGQAQRDFSRWGLKIKKNSSHF